MVGVPGKSAGCTTCRRRKVKCDATKPTCLRCCKSAIKCEGYNRFPVFINRTQKAGLLKRTPLEEVKPESAMSISSFSSPDTEATLLIAWFWDSFARSPPSRYALQSPSHWVDHILKQYPTCLALQSSLLAVATVRLAKATDRPDVLSEGRRLYTQSLTLTREAMRCRNEALKDEILTNTCVMVLYELFDSSTQSLHGWLQHLRGLCRLIECRGPKMHARPAAHAIFEHSRYLIMLQHLFARKGSIFSLRAWLDEPWHGLQKSVEQQVFDHGLRLASIFERCDAATIIPMKPAEQVVLLQECVDIYETLLKIQEGHIIPALDDENRHCPGPSAYHQSPANPAAHLLNITALAIRLGACESAFGLVDISLETPPPQTISLKTCGEVKHTVRRSVAERRMLAQMIVHQTSQCLEAPLGALGAARMVFSLRLAIKHLQPGDADLQQCQSMLDELSGKTSKFRPILGEDGMNVVRSRAKLVQDNSNQIARQWVEYIESNDSRNW